MSLEARKHLWRGLAVVVFLGICATVRHLRTPEPVVTRYKQLAVAHRETSRPLPCPIEPRKPASENTPELPTPTLPVPANVYEDPPVASSSAADIGESPTPEESASYQYAWPICVSTEGTAPFWWHNEHMSAYFTDQGVDFRLGFPGPDERASEVSPLHWTLADGNPVHPKGEGELQRDFPSSPVSTPVQAYSASPSYNKVVYANIQDGKSLTVESHPSGLKSTLYVEAGFSRPSFRFTYQGADALEILNDGLALSVKTKAGELLESGLLCYQPLSEQEKRFVNARYTTIWPTADPTTWEYEIVVDGADPALPLVIDPLFTFRPRSHPLRESGPVVASVNGQVFEHLRIVSTEGDAIRVSGIEDVVIRNCLILHRGGPGIRFSRARNIRIESTEIIHVGAPAQGPHSDTKQCNITGSGSLGVVIQDVRLVRGSSGIYLLDCPNATLRLLEGHDFRGPYPRGQFVQFNQCDGSRLEDFSCENSPDRSYPEDIVSVYNSSHVTLRRGLVDGNNSRTGVGIMFEMDRPFVRGGLCEDVDAIRQANAGFSAYPGRDVTFRRTRVRDLFTFDQGRGLPSSGGIGWCASPDSSANLAIEDSLYFNMSGRHLYWSRRVFNRVELTERDFLPRPPVRLRFCWGHVVRSPRVPRAGSPR